MEILDQNNVDVSFFVILYSHVSFIIAASNLIRIHLNKVLKREHGSHRKSFFHVPNIILYYFHFEISHFRSFMRQSISVSSVHLQNHMMYLKKGLRLQLHHVKCYFVAFVEHFVDHGIVHKGLTHPIKG